MERREISENLSNKPIIEYHAMVEIESIFSEKFTEIS